MRQRVILDLYEKLRTARENKEKALRVVWIAEAKERKIVDFIEKYMSMKEFIEKAQKNENEMGANVLHQHGYRGDF